MQLFHDARLILSAAPAAVDADSSAPPGDAGDGAPAFAAVFGSFPPGSLPADLPGKTLAGSTGEAVPDTLTGKLLPAAGSPLPTAQAGAEKALLDAHLPAATLPGARFAPYSPQGAESPPALDVVFENGRLRVAAGERTDRLTPSALTSHPATPSAIAKTGYAVAAGQAEIGPSVAGAAVAPVRPAVTVPGTAVVADARSSGPFPEVPAAQAQQPITDRATAPSSGPADSMALAPSRIDPADFRGVPESVRRDVRFEALAQASQRRRAGRVGVEARFRDTTRRSPVVERPITPETSPSLVTSGSLRAEFPDALRWRHTAGGPAVPLRLDPASSAGPGAFAPEVTATFADTAASASDAGATRIVPPAAPGPTTAASVPGAAPTFSVEPPVLDPAWQTAVGERVVWMAARGLHNAELRLNPAELGPMQLQVSVDDGRVSVSITALQAATREALEAAMPRLRELLAENGMDLAGADVSGGGVEQRSDDGNSQRPEELLGLADGADEVPAEGGAAATAEVAGRPSSAVDLYA